MLIDPYANEIDFHFRKGNKKNWQYFIGNIHKQLNAYELRNQFPVKKKVVS